jgi:hypothetical protein
MLNLSFRTFIEEFEQTPNYFSSMKDNLGVDLSALKGSNWMASAAIGNITYNGIQYKITRFVYDDDKNITGAMIKPLDVKGVNTTSAYVKRGDKQIKVPDSSIDTTERFVSMSDLNKISTQGFEVGGAGAGGLPI